jgi:hypothetical protein
MKIKEYIEKIIQKNKKEDMEKLSDMLEDLTYKMKEYDEECYHKYKMKLYEMAYGCILTDDMKREWVSGMKPMAKWTEEEVENVVKAYGINIPVTSAYVIMNMLYSDMKIALGNGDDEESLKRYIEATKGWYFDEDSKYTKEEKLFKYYFKVVK